MKNQQTAALYCRISRDDERFGESASIETQKNMLEQYAKSKGFAYNFYIDDGYSGTNFDRPSFNQMIADIQEKKVDIVIVKDLSRLGRNYIEVGQLTETLFPQYNIRFIAVNDGVDNEKGEDDFTPFRNIMNEWYAKDMSRKMRSALKTKSKQGYAIGHPPLGYKYDEVDPRRWVIDEEGAEIVRRMYQMRLGGMSINDMAKLLKREKVLTPSAYAFQKGYRQPTKKSTRGEYFWDTSIVRQILTNQAYIGDVINFRTYSKSFKLKDRLQNDEKNWEVHEGVHEAVIERCVWESVQKTFGDTKYRKPKHVEKNMFAGFLKCSDCGANLNYKHTHDNPENHYFSCRNKRANNGLCKTTHHIRVDVIERLVRDHLAGIIQFASLFEDEFVKIVVDEHYKQIQIQQKRNQESLAALLLREKELDTLFEKIYEDQALGRLSEERFQKLSYKYEDEQSELKQRIKHLKAVVAKEKTHEMNANGFLQIVKKYTEITEVTLEILNEFIDKIVVHHREQLFGETVQKVEIYYKMIGYVELPEMDKEEKASYLHSFGRSVKDRIAV